MIRYYDPEDIRQADILAVEKYGITSLELMENAGTNAASEVMKRYPEALSILIFAGPGNNGGDGFVAARFFLDKGLKVRLILSADPDSYKGDAKTNLDTLMQLNAPECTVKYSKDLSDIEIKKEVNDADCLIDSLLGTGSKGAPRGEVERLIKHCQNRAVVAFDIPSGIDPLSGNVYDPCVKADLTVTFLAAKRGMCFFPAYDMCGTVVVADIGISPDKVLDDNKSILSFGREDIPKLLPKIPKDIHKGKKGGLLVVGGSVNYRGAPLLAGLGALRSGAGLIVLAIPDFMVDSASLFLPEAIFVPLRTRGDAVLPESLAEAIAPWEKRCDAAAVGPGLGRNEGSGSIIDWFWNKWEKPLLVDGDGLHFLSFDKYKPAFRANAVITPHVGEAANLLGATPEDINNDRIGAAVSMSCAAGTILLKGMDTVVYSKGKSITIIKGGSPSLAVPGSGDVLSGSVGALMACGMPIYDAVVTGAAAHAAAGSFIEKRSGIRGTLAREIADALPFTLN
ncbi:MAG: Bifunctional NAD(P)H-hydrate repair enzyme Nnr [Synergistaceae bacterium]